MIIRGAKSLILPASGGGQAYAEVTSSQTGISTIADLTGLTISPVPDSTQMLLLLHLEQLTKDATGGIAIGWITDPSNVAVARAPQSIIAAGQSHITALRLLTGLTPGTAVTYKARLQSATTTVDLTSAGNTQRSFIVALRA